MACPETYQKVLHADLLVRPLAPDDVPAVLDIERQGYSHPWSESVFLDCFKDNYRLWGVCHGDMLMAYAVVAYFVDEAHLLNICVHPRGRGEGVGRYLLRHVLATAAHEGMSQLLLEVRVSNHAAIALYQSEGFHEIGQRPGYYPAANGREDARVLMRALGR
ncbi:ribosomal protein S18-alanine N-acetyltransferase [Marinobacter adhaerens]|uniref:ribosomal protein S18-alanine N-acetyltransferase n=1 Tax=Marinobacter adhaerens TaxID=1033846 RepID=UPI001E54B8FA|nr:ribosomal protein S18-alanine N-acetyltransferase [Marinobacter adhaerens]MCD1649041.1 ribosomal protein S18-alanine N-acetyltransferase [Marinobacter adhaerens]